MFHVSYLNISGSVSYFTPESGESSAIWGERRCQAGSRPGGLAAGLEFKMGSEILRTVIVRNFSEIGMVAAINFAAGSAGISDSLGD
mgnify:CR=1 FL=1